ncbi:MAG: hypothetical protein HGA96_10650 [Desulfobulbaceae bacterium]|nr:hypothetical protein [Desulfobulbaceae bacterium]
MATPKPPLFLLILGWIAIIAIPTTFFIFGWRDIELTCRRTSPGALPTCQIRESFAMGLHTRQAVAEQVSGVGFQVRSSSNAARPGGGSTLTSTVVFATPAGEVPISRVASNVETEAKQELVRAVQAFLATPESLEFHHQAGMRSIFGYLGVVGVAGLAGLFFLVVWYQLRRVLGLVKPVSGL